MTLIESLIEGGWLKTSPIIEAFKKIKRVDFLTEEMKDLAELNEALPIGYGQTISQPLVVAFMLELLQPQPGDKILDIGSGSGWTSALLAEIVGEQGKVIAIEVIPELMEFGKKNIEKYNFIKTGIVECICTDGSKGYQKAAPYDGILVSAAVQTEVPRAWKEQLKTRALAKCGDERSSSTIGGRIVTPIGNSIWLFVKKSEKRGDEPSVHLHSALKDFVFEEKEYPGFVFVPLIEK